MAGGAFTFIDVPARSFDVIATDPVSGLHGVASGLLNPGSQTSVRLVLQATASVSGRLLLASGLPAAGVTAELKQTTFGSTVDLFTTSDAIGVFVFQSAPTGAYVLNLEDPLGNGVAHRNFQVGTAVALGDITLDEAPPSVTSVSPQPSAIGVARNAVIQIVLSEPVTGESVTQANISLTGPAGPVVGTLQITSSTTIVFTPVNPLAEQTRYALTVRGLTDLVGKTIAPAFTSAFTTIDLTPPAIVELTPSAGGSGAALASVIRVKYSEPIDVTGLSPSPIIVQSGGSIVAGRTDVILGNTTIVFTPTVPLAADTQYQVQVQAVTDLSGNRQPQPLVCAFRTLDRTPPQVTASTSPATARYRERHRAGRRRRRLFAGHIGRRFLHQRSTGFRGTDRAVHVECQAIPSLGAPGSQIKISALATDTSGNGASLQLWCSCRW